MLKKVIAEALKREPQFEINVTERLNFLIFKWSNLLRTIMSRNFFAIK